MFEGCEQVMQIEGAGLRPPARADRQCEPALPRGRQHGLPFAIAAVEGQHAVAGFEPQHAAEVMCLRSVKRNARALVERGIDVKARHAKVAAGHRNARLSPVILACYPVWVKSAAKTRENHRFPHRPGRRAFWSPVCRVIAEFKALLVG
jgi:hypothetical protein